MIPNEKSTVNPWQGVEGENITRHVVIRLTLVHAILYLQHASQRSGTHGSGLGVRATGTPRIDVAGLLICNRGHGVSLWAHQTNLVESADLGITENLLP